MQIPAAVADAMRVARRVVALTGAGVSAESGVPTFRDAQQGLWAEYDPQQLATPEAFRRDPALVWRWYRWRRELVARAEPNPGHAALAALADRVPAFTLVTQNVDGLHQRAGSRDVIEYHGNLFATRCFDRHCDYDPPDIDAAADVPRCLQCNGPLRPGVVWFGEPIPAAAMDAANAASRGCDVFLSVGTSSLVWPAASLADLAAANDAVVIEINLDATPLSGQSHFCLQGKSGEILPELVDCLPC